MKHPKIDHAKAALELRAAGVEPVEPYPGVTSKPFNVRCLLPRCPGHETPFPTYMSSVRSLAKTGKTACLPCRARLRADQRRAEMIRLGRVLPMEVVVDARTATRSWCLRCWKVCLPGPRLDNLKNGQGGCHHCSGKMRLPDDEARQCAREWGYIPDPAVPYVNDATKWPGRCIANGHKCEPVLNSRFRSGPCETCASHGFKPDKPALLYVVTRSDLAAAKIGICEDSPRNSRLYEHRLNGWTVITTMGFEVGADARSVEDRVVRSWRKRGMEPVKSNGMGYDGYSETVSLSELTVVEIWREVCDAAGRSLEAVLVE